MATTAATRANPFDLAGKIALVTGSTMGIGEGIARTLAQAGAHVVISSRKAEDCARVAQQFRNEGLSAEPRVCHIGRMEDIASMAAHLNLAHGGLDILVNNAVLSPWRSIEDTDPALFMKAVEVNLRGNWYLGVYNNELTNNVAYRIRARLPVGGLLPSALPTVVTNQVIPVLFVALGTYTGIMIIMASLKWYQAEICPRTKSA